MGVIRNKGAWWIDYYVNGQRKRERIGGPLTMAMKKVASDTLAKRKVEIAENKFLDKKKESNCTFKKLAELYKEWAKTNHRGFRSTQIRVNQFVNTFGDSLLKNISPLEIDRFLQERATLCKPATVNREAGVLRHMFTKAIEWELVIENPARHIRKLHAENKRLRFLDAEEISSLLEAADKYLYPILLVALNTGMRRGELFKLQWKDIDFRNQLVRIADSKNGESREIPMNRTLEDTLRGIPRRLDLVFVFPGKTGRGITDIKKRFKTAREAAQIEDFRFHDLRHTFASHLVMGGVDLATVKELLGHKRIEMTLRYAHLAPEHKRAAVQLMDTYMDTKANKAALLTS
jgi:integrase